MTTPEHPTAATMYCLGCSYCLDGLTESRCPECGRSFDSRDFSTVATNPTRVRTQRLTTLLLVCASLALALVLWPMIARGNQSESTVVGIILDLCVLGFAVPTAFTKRHRSSWELSLAILLAVIPVGYVGLIVLMGFILMQLK